MIESYDLDEAIGQIEGTLQVIGQWAYLITIGILILWLIINLYVWKFGASKKSERFIKAGIRNSLMSVVLLVITIIAPSIFSLIRFIANRS